LTKATRHKIPRNGRIIKSEIRSNDCCSCKLAIVLYVGDSVNDAIIGIKSKTAKSEAVAQSGPNTIVNNVLPIVAKMLADTKVPAKPKLPILKKRAVILIFLPLASVDSEYAYLVIESRNGYDGVFTTIRAKASSPTSGEGARNGAKKTKCQPIKVVMNCDKVR